jgi:hypothetical protein
MTDEAIANFLSTILGSVLAFSLGIHAFRIQMNHQKEQDKENDFQRSISYLNIMIESAVSNIESIINLRTDIVDQMHNEATEIAKFSEALEHQSDELLNQFITEFLIPKWNSCRFLFLHCPMPEQYKPPHAENIHSIIDEIPSVYYLLFRGDYFYGQSIEQIRIKNELTKEQSQEPPNGIVTQRLKYYTRMQTGLAINIHTNMELSLVHYMTFLAQIDEYRKNVGSRATIRRWEFTTHASNMLPSAQDLKGYRIHIREFNKNGRSALRPFRSV